MPSPHAGPLLLSMLIGWVAAPSVAPHEPGTITHADHPEPGDPQLITAPGPPANLEIGVFQTVVEQMWHASPTFRRQCARLAGAPSLTVRLRAEPPRTGAPFRAFTRISESRRGGTAEVAILFPGDAIELIAHELEHVIEHLDGAERDQDACARRLPRGRGKPYETCRAIERGQQVAREVAQRTQARVRRLRQQDTLSGPLDPASARVSADGRHVVFTSAAGLLPGAPAGRNLYVQDLQTGHLQLASERSGWSNGYLDFRHPGISSDGRLLVVEARRAADDSDAFGWEIVAFDRRTATARVIHIGEDESAGARNSTPVISSDGSAVAFESISISEAQDVTPRSAVYLARLHSGKTERIDVPTAVHGPGVDDAQRTRRADVSPAGKSMTPAVNADGRYVAFASTANLACDSMATCRRSPAERRNRTMIFVRDTTERFTTRIDRAPDGGEPNGHSYKPAISADGRYVAFTSEASNLVRGDSNGTADVFVHDRLTGTTELVSRRQDGSAGNGASRHAVLSGDGAMVAFQSLASDLTCRKRCEPHERDINLLWDVFLLDRRSGAMRRASAGPDGEWMAASRSPSLDHAGGVLVFSSRHPVDDADLMNDDDLYIQMLPVTHQE